jgi:hemolysin-activating ACP:hemolysin acyltransferase
MMIDDQTVESERPTRRNADTLGEILWLFAHSRIHRGWRLADLELFVFPALKTNRYKVYKRDERPIGYVSVALLSKAIEDRWLAGGYLLQPEDWISGDRPWVMDFVVPFGDIVQVRRLLAREPEVAGKPVRALRPNKGGKGVRVVTHGRYQARYQAAWINRLANHPDGAVPLPESFVGQAWSQKTTENAQIPGTNPLPHGRELIWAKPERWIMRCSLRYKDAWPISEGP